MLFLKKGSSWFNIFVLVLFLFGLQLQANRIGGSNWEETKEALRTVHYSYAYTINKKISEEVEEKYTFIEPIMHEYDNEWLAALVLGKGRKMTIVFGGADDQDVKDFCNHFAGRHPAWGRGSIPGKVHGGFLKHFHALWPHIYEAIIEYAHETKRDPAKIDFDIVGHSMGSGLAQIAALRLKTGLLYRTIKPKALFLDLPMYTEENRPSQIKVLTFGGMRVLDDVAASYYRNRLDLEATTLRIVHENDWVINKIPRIFGVTHVGSCVELFDPAGYIDVVTGKVASSHMLPSYNVALNQLVADEDDFVENFKNRDKSFFGSVVGFTGYATTVPTELILNMKKEHKEEAERVNKERETADRLATFF